jgi:hypothetical protein
MVLLYGRAGHLTVKKGGFRPGQVAELDAGEVVFAMGPGDGLFFSNFTMHRSEPNRSGETRMFYAIAYQLADADAKL